ncbi:MAG: sugar-binding transcriptional regulator [Candidatus Caldatribacteriaceae bacterium]
MDISSDKELLANIAKLYYLDDLSIIEIANILGMSRQRCSRLLKRAKEEGIVQIEIVDPAQEGVSNLARELEKTFPLRRAHVVSVFTKDSDLIRRAVGEAGARFFLKTVVPGNKIGIAYGRTLYELVRYVKPSFGQENLNPSVVQLMGGLSRISANVFATEIPKRLAEALNAQVYYLPAPAFTKDRATRDAMLKDESIQATLKEKIDLALVGIGSVSPNAMLMQTGAITQEEYKELQSQNAVGDICGTFFDIQGKIVEFSGNERRIAVSLNDLRKKCPLVIGVAGGLEKTEAILGALRGNFLHALVVDGLTAAEILRRVESK